MGFAVYHAEKGKLSSGGIGSHIDRKNGFEHTYRHADPTRQHLNKLWKGNRYTKMNLSEAINERIKEGYKGKTKIRKDAVRYVTHILTASHKEMTEIFIDKAKSDKWIFANLQWAKDEFGHDNIMRFVIHMDEKTPHIHLVTVPITNDGKLSAKEVMGGPKEMAERQDRYALAMNPFGLERGIKSTGIQHENAKEYYARIKIATETANKAILEPSKNFLGNYKEDSVHELQNALKSANLALNDFKLRLEGERKKTKSKEQVIERLNQQVHKNIELAIKRRENLEAFEKKFVEIIRDPNKSDRMRKHIIERDQRSDIEQSQTRGKRL